MLMRYACIAMAIWEKVFCVDLENDLRFLERFSSYLIPYPHRSIVAGNRKPFCDEESAR